MSGLARILILAVLGSVLVGAHAAGGAGQGGASSSPAALPAGSNVLTVVNCGDKPIYATAVTLPATTLQAALGLTAATPLRATTAGGDRLALVPGVDQGREVVRAFLSLKAGERLDLKLEPASEWGEANRVASAHFDAASGRALLGNGVLAFEYRDGQWSLSFDGPMAGSIVPPRDRQIVSQCWLDTWLDSELRGRLMGADPKGLGLIHSRDARLAGGKATVNPDGSATLELVRHFGGFAADIVWTEYYTLLPGQPVLTYRTVFENRGDEVRYLAYVDAGGSMRGRFGGLLRDEPLLKYEDPKAPNGVLLSGPSNSGLRVAWRGERCWLGVGSGSGCGIGFSTTANVTRTLLGSTVWNVGASGFQICLLDTGQGNFPYALQRGQPLDTGLAFVAACGDASIWNQTRQVFADVTSGRTPQLNGACAVYLGGIPLQAGEVRSFREDEDPGLSSRWVRQGTVHRAALATDFQRPCRLSATASHATATNVITLRARPLDAPDRAVELMTLDRPGSIEVDFTALTGWMGQRRAYTLEVSQPAMARLAKLTLAPAPFPAPELSSPADNLSLTDLAVCFRWKGVEGAMDYELQLARDAQFSDAKSLRVRSEIEWPLFLPSDEQLPSPGTWFWRVRAVEPGQPGAWSEARRMDVNNDHEKAPLKFTITPERPLITMELLRVKDLAKFRHTLPEDLRPYVAYNISEKFGLMQMIEPLRETDQKVFVRTHHPSPVTGWTPLADIEALFQTYPNVLGVMGGESLSALYHGGLAQTYTHRLLKLCGKHGRIYYEGDGTYPAENKWEALYRKQAPLLRDYGGYLVFAQKNNILHRQFVSQSSVLGLYVSGAIGHQGAWEDGGWYWQQVGFRKLGDLRGQRGGTTEDMPRIFWGLTFLMGLSRGCAVFSLDGQTGIVPVREGYRLAESGWPAKASPSAYCTTEGELTPVFHRYLVPFLRGMIQHRMIPGKAQVLEQIRLAVYNDGVKVGKQVDPYYFEYQPLYAGTYGFRPSGVFPGELMEFFPNTGRYYYIPVFPQGKVGLGRGIQTLPLSELQEPDAVATRFRQAYPQWYQGDALVTRVGDVLTVMNSHENTDVTETYDVPLQRGNFIAIQGRMAPHAYLMGRFEDGNRRFWCQINGEYAEREVEIAFLCKARPQVKITPTSAATIQQWDAATGRLTLKLSHAQGAAEVELYP